MGLFDLMGDTLDTLVEAPRRGLLGAADLTAKAIDETQKAPDVVADAAETIMDAIFDD